MGYVMETVTAGSDHAGQPDVSSGFHTVAEDMSKVAEALGVSRLCDINEEQFRRSLTLLQKKVKKGELTQLQIDRAQHFFDENERVLAASIALKTGNFERFIDCINGSGLKFSKK
jgi:galactokinase